MNSAESTWHALIGVYKNEKTIIIIVMSGHRGAIEDPQARPRFLPPSAPDAELGAAAIEALGESRFIALDEFRVLYSANAEHYKKRLGETMGAYGYKTKRAFFESMKYCTVTIDEEAFTIVPTRQDQLDGWEGLKSDVIIPIQSLPTEVGSAIRPAFDRCL
jgi:hypothetical protein